VIKDFLGFQAETWQQGQYRKKRIQYFHSLVKKGFFYSGFIPRVIAHLESRGISYTIERIVEKEGFDSDVVDLPGITFRDDQLEVLNTAAIAGRGVWKAPTASGKTIIMAGLIARCVYRVLVIVHTTDLFDQTIEELEKFFVDVGQIGCGKNKPADITVAMIQTLHGMVKKKKWIDVDEWGMVLVDEAHHVGKFGGSYDAVLKNTLAPLRFGVTATPSDEPEASMAMEGLLGPVLGETGYEELQEEGILAKPKIRIVWVPEGSVKQRIDKLRKERKKTKGKPINYKDIYDIGVVTNRLRNGIIVREAKKLIEEGLTVLIMVERIEHGELLLRMADACMSGVFTYLHGSTPSQIKAEEKQFFAQKERRGVIATRIWSEGVNIRSMGAVVNAVGGLSERAVIQRFGRGMRADEDKTEVKLIDLFDSSHNYFIRHSGRRLCLYFEQKWLGEE
jgi:superfamily II DNA or RNA helicase